MSGMTPLEVVTRAAAYFDGGGFCFHFTVPDNRSMENFPARVRVHANKRGYSWRVSYWGKGRAWLIKRR